MDSAFNGQTETAMGSSRAIAWLEQAAAKMKL